MAKWQDAPQRPSWLDRLPWRKRRTWLIREYLQRRIELAKDRREKANCRRFLAVFDPATSDGNPAGVELSYRPCVDDPLAVLIYPEIPGVGCVTWMPCLKIEGTERLADIIQQTDPFSAGKMHHEPVSRPKDAPPRKGGFPKKPESEFYPGRPAR